MVWDAVNFGLAAFAGAFFASSVIYAGWRLCEMSQRFDDEDERHLHRED